MNEFVDKFKSRIDSFWDVNEDEKKNILSDVLKYANSNQQKFKNEINQVKFDKDLMALPIISEALSTDTENWGQFYVDLLDDILETARQSSKPNDVLNNLQEFAYIEKDNRPFVQKIVDRLYKELESEELDIKLASIWTLPNFIDNSSIKNKSSIVEKLRQQLFDQNWKVRVVAFKSLGYGNLLPDGYKLSLKDKVTKLILGEPPII
jgi:hypothetical protein